MLSRPCNFWFEDNSTSSNRSVTSSRGRIVDIFERDKLWSANEATNQSRPESNTLRSLSSLNESVLGSEGVVEHSIASICRIETSRQIAPASSRQRSSRDNGEANNEYLRTNKVPPHWAQLVEESSNFYQPDHEFRPSTWQSLFIESETEDGDFNSDSDLLRQPSAEATNSAQEARSSLALNREGVSAPPQRVSVNDAAINDPSIGTSRFTKQRPRMRIEALKRLLLTTTI